MSATLPKIQPDFFADIRAGYEFVAQNARHVKINMARLQSYCDELVPVPQEKLLDSGHHYRGDEESTAAYIFALDSINFGSGYKPFMAAEGFELIEGSTYYTLSVRLKNWFETKGVLFAPDLATLRLEDIAELLQLDVGKPYSGEFAALCQTALNQTGAFIQSQYGGRFMNFIEASKGQVANFVPILTQVPNFNDSHPYHGRIIAFHKRAQITACYLQLDYAHKDQVLFSDIHNLTMFADNAVPHVLYMDRMLEYTPELAAKIKAGEPIPCGSDEEIEIRACAAHAVELIAARKGMTSMQIDHILWHRSADDAHYKTQIPHRTLSWFY